MAVGDPVVVVAPTIVRVTYKHSQPNGRFAYCVVDLSLDEFGISRDAAVLDLVGGVASPWQDNILSQIAGNITFLGGTWIDLDSPDGLTGSFGPAAGHPTTGSITGTAFITPQVSYLVHKTSAARRGHRQGRMYVPGLAESEVGEQGEIQASRITSFNTKLSALRTAYNALGTTLGISTVAWRTVHVTKGTHDDPATWTWSSSTVDNVFLDTRCATQRRRLRG